MTLRYAISFEWKRCRNVASDPHDFILIIGGHQNWSKIFLLMSVNYSRSLYRSHGGRDFCGTENEIWAGFGQVGSTKNFGLGRKILLLLKAIFLNIATSALKSCKEKTINFCLKIWIQVLHRLMYNDFAWSTHTMRKWYTQETIYNSEQQFLVGISNVFMNSLQNFVIFAAFSK